MTADAEYWDGQAPAFDDQADHGLRDPHIREAWNSSCFRISRQHRP